jgi:hypothetical protein
LSDAGLEVVAQVDQFLLALGELLLELGLRGLGRGGLRKIRSVLTNPTRKSSACGLARDSQSKATTPRQH